MADLFDVVVARKLSGGGGGGSSDFSTATLSFDGNGEENVVLYGAFVLDDYSEATGTFTSEDECQLILYKGAAYIITETDATLTVSGNITDEGHGSYMVTGDCTITIS